MTRYIFIFLWGKIVCQQNKFSPKSSKFNLNFFILRDLGENEIDRIPEGLFQKCPNLRQIELKTNPLTDIHPDAFVQLPHLEKL